MRNSTEYRLIEREYGVQRAARSQVLLIDHIHQGLQIMDLFGASVSAKQAFCLHPLVQNFTDLEANLSKICREELLNPRALILAMEYRHKANSFLCKPENDHYIPSELKALVGELLPEVRHMLIADKIQNNKDFMLHHYGTHERSAQLKDYFEDWFHVLDVSPGEVRVATQRIYGVVK
jgi:hypothetical protein